jgi:hypothetical protein
MYSLLLRRAGLGDECIFTCTDEHEARARLVSELRKLEERCEILLVRTANGNTDAVLGTYIRPPQLHR